MSCRKRMAKVAWWPGAARGFMFRLRMIASMLCFTSGFFFVYSYVCCFSSFWLPSFPSLFHFLTSAIILTTVTNISFSFLFFSSLFCSSESDSEPAPPVSYRVPPPMPLHFSLTTGTVTFLFFLISQYNCRFYFTFLRTFYAEVSKQTQFEVGKCLIFYFCSGKECVEYSKIHDTPAHNAKDAAKPASAKTGDAIKTGTAAKTDTATKNDETTRRRGRKSDAVRKAQVRSKSARAEIEEIEECAGIECLRRSKRQRK